MRQLLVFILIFTTYSTQAYDCPQYLEQRSDAKKTLQWLKNFEGLRQVGECQVEIILCKESTTYNQAAPLGEILVIDDKGREAYISIDFPEKNSPVFSTKIKSHSRMLNINKKDRFYEEINGRTEVWRLEMRTGWFDTRQLKAFELGIYSTNNQLNQSNGNDSYWYTCYEEDL